MIINFSDLDKNLYDNFLLANPTTSSLNIRTSSANLAVPVSGVRITVSKEIDGNMVIFYTGITDSSGVINNISLPTPSISSNDLEVPLGTDYDIEASFESFNKKYSVLMYPNIHSTLNINIIPGDNYGS